MITYLLNQCVWHLFILLGVQLGENNIKIASYLIARDWWRLHSLFNYNDTYKLKCCHTNFRTFKCFVVKSYMVYKSEYYKMMVLLLFFKKVENSCIACKTEEHLKYVNQLMQAIIIFNFLTIFVCCSMLSTYHKTRTVKTVKPIHSNMPREINWMSDYPGCLTSPCK